ncbi:MAG: hypothetical protein IJF83_13530 [Methanobrevibacter sp.]|nr:hypothetical protein [Methanobrevibacter sp.]
MSLLLSFVCLSLISVFNVAVLMFFPFIPEEVRSDGVNYLHYGIILV